MPSLPVNDPGMGNQAAVSAAVDPAIPAPPGANFVVPSMPQSTQPVNAGGNTLLDALFKAQKLTAEQVDQLKKTVVTSGKTMEEAALEAGVAEEVIYQTKAGMFGVEYVDLNNMELDQELLNKIPADAARQNMAVIIGKGFSGYKVAMSDPLDIQKVKYVGAIVGGSIEPVIASPSQITNVIDHKYGAQVGSAVDRALEDVGDQVTNLSGVATEVTDLGGSADLANAPVSKIVNMVLEYAIRYKSSDVHIEPRENKIGVRFRVFGVLSEKLTLPKKLLAAVVSRVKILASLKIDEHRVPQDGRFQVKLGEEMVDLRVSIVPTVYGEKVVMRLLQKGGGAMDLPSTGIRGHAYKIFTEAFRKTQGIVLVTGPTGSGKTQTLASVLKVLNTPEVNIMTLEDPVEIRIDGVNQVQINAEVGLTFARGLRSFLRQDPNIIMVGEIRDSETAGLAVQASLTGHLVLATLHTNSAASAPPRLIDMGVEPFLLASTMNVVLAQRLVRKICTHCREAYYASPEMVDAIHKVMDGIKPQYDVFKLPNNQDGDPNTPSDDKLVLYRGKGCPQCNNTGYNGRVGIFEALDINEKVSKLILQRESANVIERTAYENGMISMIQDGFMKALEGVTTIEEILRVQSH